MAGAEAIVAVTELGGAAQWKLRVRVDGEAVLNTQYVKIKFGGVERRNESKLFLETPANWPKGADVRSPRAWELLWEQHYAEYDESVRKREGHMKNAHSAGPKWFGTLDVDSLKEYGWIEREDTVEASDCRKLVEAGKGLPMAKIHGGAYASHALSMVLMRREEAEQHREENGGKMLPGHHRCSAALEGVVVRMAEALAKEAGKPMEAFPFVELIRIREYCNPQPWHADFKASGPVLASATVLSEEAVPTYFIDLSIPYKDKEMKVHRPWVDSEEKPGRSETSAATFLQLRAERWRVVHRSGDNHSVHVPVTSPSHAKLGLTPTGKARSVRATTQFGEPSRERGGQRPTRPIGSTVFFDATSPHRGPGRAKGEGERFVLYVTWAGPRAWELGAGVPWLALPPPAKQPPAREGLDYKLLFDAKGRLLLEEKTPIERRGEGSARKRPRREAAEPQPQPSGPSEPVGAGTGLDLLTGARPEGAGEGTGTPSPSSSLTMPSVMRL